MNKQLSQFYWLQLFFRYVEKCLKKGKSSLSLGRKYTNRKYTKKDNEEETEIPQQNWETEVLIESENAIGNQDDSEQAVPQKDTNVKDTNVCRDMLPKVFDKSKSVKMEGFLVKLLTLICSDLFPFESICFILFQSSYIGNSKYSLFCCITIFYRFLIFVTYTFM